jgi:hypothetical protein
VIEQEAPFTEGEVDLDDWKRKARKVNAAMRMLQVDARAPRTSFVGNLKGKLAAEKRATGFSHQHS